MKLSNTVVSAIVIVAVLVSAYALGLLIRQARTGGSRVQAPAEVNTAVASHGPGEGRTKDTPEERAKIKDQKAQALEKMKAATPEEKQKFREQVRQQMGSRPPGKGPKDFSSGRQGKKPKRQSPAEANSPKEDVNAPATPGDSATTESNTDKTGSESGRAGPGGVQP